MPSNSPVAKTSAVATTASLDPPIPQEYSATVSSGSLLLSIAAVVLSSVSLFRSKKLERGARFESAFGSAVRAELRSFERVVLKMRAFVFPAGKSVVELKAEFETLRVELEEASHRLAALLRELDKAQTVRRSDWEATFERSTSQAEMVMQAVAHPAVSSEIDFRAKAELARTRYHQAIDDVRANLDSERARV